jgi:hypothetical protein
LIAPDGADTAADLVGEGLEGEAVIGGSEGGTEGIAGTLGGLGAEEGVDGFFETAVQELLIAVERDMAAGFQVRAGRKVEAVEGGEEKEGADPVVEVIAVPAEVVEDSSFPKELGDGEPITKGVKGLIADGGIG